jgi:hypothetical protein
MASSDMSSEKPMQANKPLHEMRQPDIEAQREAMKKLGFLVGKWSGEARILRAPGEMLELIQTEEAQYKLDGLILLIEGMGRTRSDSQLALQALGIASYDDAAGKYRMRAYNNGHWLETEVALIDGEQGIRWGFSFGDLKTSSTLRINELGEWTELAELTIGDQPPRKFMELAVRRES